MTIRVRKFIGMLAIVGFLILYSLLAMGIGANYIVTLPRWGHFVYFAIAGMAWLPAVMMIIRWMVRPDAPGKA